MNKYIYLAAAAFMLAACNNDEMPATADTDVALKVNAAIGSVSTRATGTKWTNGDQIGITTTSDTRTKYSNVPYECNGAAFNAVSEIIYFQDAQEVTFSAYYPYDEDGGIIENTISAADQAAGSQPQIDYLFAAGATASKADPTVNFTGDQAFSHRMSQITLTFINGDDVTLDGKLTDYTLGGLMMEGSFDTATGEAKATGTQAADLTIDLSNVTTAEGKYTAASLILFPQAAATASLSLTVEGVTYTATLTIPGGELQAGDNYLFPVTVNKTGLRVGTAEIKDWTDVPGDEANATM